MKVTKMISRKMAGGMLLGFLVVAGMVMGSQGSMTVYAAEELQGSGTADDPYVITGSEDLWQFAEIVDKSEDRNECAKVADGVTQIDTTVRGEETGLTWNPIGDPTISYKGIFDGNGTEITIHVDRESDTHAGLFGILGSSGEIRNVTTAGSVKGKFYVGGICGEANGAKIVNCNNKADVTAVGSYAGGLVGYASGAQIESDTSISNTGAITGVKSVGGLVGAGYTPTNITAHGEITNSGSVTGTSNAEYVGGLVGYASDMFIQANGDISNDGKIHNAANGDYRGTGGLIGYGEQVSLISQNGRIQNYGEVTAAIKGVGGIVGFLENTGARYPVQAAKGIFNMGKITGKMSVGGLLGESACYLPMTSTEGFMFNAGDVEGNGDNVGGVIGRMATTTDSGNYGNMGNVKNTGKYTGGVIGLWNIASTSLENTFNAGNVEVTGEDATDVGGIVGKFMGGNIKNCFHTTEYPLIGNGEDEKEEITGKISNCYCMEANTSPWNGEITKTMEEFSSGEVAYLLDGSGEDRNQNLFWGQNIGTDKTPILRGKTVYQDGSTYSNTAGHLYGDPQYAWNESDMSFTAYRLCQRCEYKETETVTATYTEEDAGCETSGKRDYRAEFTNPAFEVQTKTVILNPLGHDYNEPMYVWNISEVTCRGYRICQRCEKIDDETVKATYTEEKAGCETSGKRDYRAEFTNPVFGVQTDTLILNPFGHDTTDVVWSKDEKVHWKDCKNECGKKLEQAEHTFKTVIDRQATESTEGSSHEECSVCGYQKAAVVIPVIKKEETTNGQPSDSNKNDQTTADTNKNDQTTTDKNNQTADTLTVGQVVVNQADGASYTIKKNTDHVYEVEYKTPKNKKQTKIVVPDTIKINGVTYKVTSIAKNAFKNNKKLKTVTIGKNVSKIGANVFTGCKKLKTITIKSTKLTAKTLSKSTFKGITKATTIKVPKKKLSAYKKLFKSRGLSSKIKVKAY